jgi:hypothetical protein
VKEKPAMRSLSINRIIGAALVIIGFLILVYLQFYYSNAPLPISILIVNYLLLASAFLSITIGLILVLTLDPKKLELVGHR